MSSEKPLILVVNDDGISAPGIQALSSIAKEFGDVVIVAPDKPQSGMGHAITINSTLHVQKTVLVAQPKAHNSHPCGSTSPRMTDRRQRRWR